MSNVTWYNWNQMSSVALESSYATIYFKIWKLSELFRLLGSKMSQLHCCELAIFETAADGHTCEIVSHANQESLSGNSSAIFETMHTCITLCNQSVSGTKQYENNEPNVTLLAKRCRWHAKWQWHLANFWSGRPI